MILSGHSHAQGLEKTNTNSHQSIGDFIGHTAATARTQQTARNTNTAPDSPLPADLISTISIANKTRIKNASNTLEDVHLVGIYTSRQQATAEFNIDGNVRYLEEDDHIKDQWTLFKIWSKSVELEKCHSKPPCIRKRILLEAQ